MAHNYVDRLSATRVEVDGVAMLAFAGCDYLGLAHHPAVKARAAEALARHGLSAGASRVTSGTSALHLQLEEALAEFVGTESALVAADGYLADLAAVGGLAPRAASILIDSDAHTSLFDAVRLAGARSFEYGQGDLLRAHALLDLHASENVLVLTDGAFTQSGRLAAANELLRHLPAAGTLLIDDSHVLGVLADRGRGSLELHGLSDDRIVVTASLAKGLGAGGGMIAGSAGRIATIRAASACFAGSTALSPAAAAGAVAALEVLEREPDRLERLRANTGTLHRMARRLGLVPRGTYLPILRMTAADAAGHGEGRGERETRRARAKRGEGDVRREGDLGRGGEVRGEGTNGDDESIGGGAAHRGGDARSGGAESAGGAAQLDALAAKLRAAGVFVQVVRYPGLAGGAQLRVNVCSEHTSDDLVRLETLLAEHMPPGLVAA